MRGTEAPLAGALQALLRNSKYVSCNNPVEKLTVLSGGLCECSNCCSCLIVSLCEQAHLWTGSHTGSFLVPVGFFSQNRLKNCIVESHMIMISDPRSLLTWERWCRSPRNMHGWEMVLRFGQDEWQEASRKQHFSPQCHCFCPCHLHSCSVWGWYVSYSFGVVILLRHVFKWHLPRLMTWIPVVNVFL